MVVSSNRAALQKDKLGLYVEESFDSRYSSASAKGSQVTTHGLEMLIRCSGHAKRHSDTVYLKLTVANLISIYPQRWDLA